MREGEDRGGGGGGRENSLFLNRRILDPIPSHCKLSFIYFYFVCSRVYKTIFLLGFLYGSEQDTSFKIRKEKNRGKNKNRTACKKKINRERIWKKRKVC